MVVSVVGAVFALILIYILASKFLCEDSVATIPFSGLNSKYVAKLQSTSSIKTLDSDEEQGRRAKAAGSAKTRK